MGSSKIRTRVSVVTYQSSVISDCTFCAVPGFRSSCQGILLLRSLLRTRIEAQSRQIQPNYYSLGWEILYLARRARRQRIRRADFPESTTEVIDCDRPSKFIGIFVAVDHATIAPWCFSGQRRHLLPRQLDISQ
jgi:hypothetical protein